LPGQDDRGAAGLGSSLTASTSTMLLRRYDTDGGAQVAWVVRALECWGLPLRLLTRISAAFIFGMLETSARALTAMHGRCPRKVFSVRGQEVWRLLYGTGNAWKSGGKEHGRACETFDRGLVRLCSSA
jgi:hypothetical protein